MESLGKGFILRMKYKGDLWKKKLDELFIRPIICSNRNRAQRPVILL